MLSEVHGRRGGGGSAVCGHARLYGWKIAELFALFSVSLSHIMEKKEYLTMSDHIILECLTSFALHFHSG